MIPTVEITKQKITAIAWSMVNTGLEPGTYELYRPGGLHISRVPCDNCGGDGFDTVQSTRGPYETDDIPCPSCVDGMTWPEWALAPHAPKFRGVTKRLLDALLEASNDDGHD